MTRKYQKGLSGSKSMPYSLQMGVLEDANKGRSITYW